MNGIKKLSGLLLVLALASCTVKEKTTMSFEIKRGVISAIGYRKILAGSLNTPTSTKMIYGLSTALVTTM